jgi:hypothetical protein
LFGRSVAPQDAARPIEDDHTIRELCQKLSRIQFANSPIGRQWPLVIVTRTELGSRAIPYGEIFRRYVGKTRTRSLQGLSRDDRLLEWEFA